jgi:hypothetical protein
MGFYKEIIEKREPELIELGKSIAKLVTQPRETPSAAEETLEDLEVAAGRLRL